MAAAAAADGLWPTDDHKGHAHDAEAVPAHPHETKAQHGGVVSVVKDVHYELVVTQGELALYVSDHGKPMDLAGAMAKLKQEVALATAGNALRAKGDFKLAVGTKVLASFQPKAGPAASARFTLP